MKRGKLLVILLLVLVTSTQLAVAQLNVWRSQNPLVAGNAAYAIQMISLKTSYACGAGGMVVRTFDGGTRWEIKTSVAGIHSALRSLSFLNETFGMCCGDSGHVIKTTDGGNTWTLLSTASLNRFNSVVVIDTNTALVVAFGGGISKTTDGGASWKNVVLEGSEALYSIRSLRPDFIYATGFAGAILKSIDTGRSWQKIATPYGNTFYSAVFANDLEATVVGDLGFITHTSDGGVSWKRQGIFVYPGPLTATMNSVDGKGTQNISAVGSGSTIVNTSNSGTDWIFCNTQKNR